MIVGALFFGSSTRAFGINNAPHDIGGQAADI
jgi:hypothetical protein